ncbi:hypothetical protein FRC03_010664 [Tulasnella sp. 419]|nr:hypothetical protein FRC03_010664 [Tulasnella sp. 419]
MQTTVLPHHAVSDALDILLKNLQPGAGDRDYLNELEGIDEAIELRNEDKRMQLALSAFNDAVLRRMVVNRRRQNQLSPIGSLPTELLMMIFESLTKTNYEDIGPSHTSTLLSGVCSRWRDMILSTPRLWNHIDSGYCQELLEASIERSRNIPLYINIKEQAELATMQHQEALCSLLLTHLSRWGSFFCSSRSLYERMSLLWMDIRMPFFQRFSLFFYVGYELQIPSAVVSNAPGLQWLEVPQSRLPALSPTLSRLRHISFRLGPKPLWLSSAQWHSFLASTPELKDLQVDGYGEQFRSDLNVSVKGPFQMHCPCLELLSFLHLPDSVVGLLLSSISLKHDKPVNVLIMGPHLDHGARKPFAIMFPESVMTSSLLGTIRGTTSISAYENASGPYLDVVLEVGSQRITVEYEGEYIITSAFDYLTALTLPDTFPNLKELKLIGAGFFGCMRFAKNINQFSSLERLMIGYPEQNHWMDLGDICEELSWGGDDPSTPPCPKLQYLAILLQNNDTFPILDLVHARYETQDSLFSSREIVPLVELRLSSKVGLTDSPTITQIKQIMEPLGTAVQIVDEEAFDPDEWPLEVDSGDA